MLNHILRAPLYILINHLVCEHCITDEYGIHKLSLWIMNTLILVLVPSIRDSYITIYKHCTPCPTYLHITETRHIYVHYATGFSYNELCMAIIKPTYLIHIFTLYDMQYQRTGEKSMLPARQRALPQRPMNTHCSALSMLFPM